MIKPLRAGIIGLGVGEAHIEGYVSAGVEVTALCDLDTAKLESVCSKYPSVQSRYQHANQLLDDPTIDVVSIASYDDDHFPQILRGLENGKHLFVEKPLCTNGEQARLIHSALRRNAGIKISSNLILRASPRFIRVREMLQSGEFGSLYHVEGDYLYGRLHKILTGWRGQSPDYSVTLGGGVHIIDLLLWLSGDAVSEVHAVGTQKVTQGSQVTFPDTVTAVLSFKSGMTGKVSSNFPCVHPHFHALSLFGERGTFQNDITGGRWFTERGREEFSTISEPYRPAGKHLLLVEFLKDLRGEVSTVVPIRAVFDALSVCFAIDLSARTNRSVTVEYLDI